MPHMPLPTTSEPSCPRADDRRQIACRKSMSVSPDIVPPAGMRDRESCGIPGSVVADMHYVKQSAVFE